VTTSVNPDDFNGYGKRPRLLESSGNSDASKKNKLPEDVTGGSNVVPDVADAIEDLLAQSNMVLVRHLSFLLHLFAIDLVSLYCGFHPRSKT